MKEGWVKKKLGDIFKTGSGGTPLKLHKEYYENGDVPWLCSGEVCQKYIIETEKYISKIGLENSSAKYFPIDTVVVAMYGATAGQVGILRLRATTNQAICGIYPNPNFIPEFLYYYLSNEHDNLVAQATGNAQPNISQIKIKNLLVPILSLDEQHHIVKKLDAGFAKIEQIKANAEKNLQQAKDLFQATLRVELSRNKASWVVKAIAEIAEVKGGKRIPKGEKLTTTPTAHPYIRVADFEIYGTVNVESVQFISNEIYNQIKRYTISDKDLYLSIAGTIGKTGIIPHELNGANLTENACKLVFQEGIYNRFIYYTSLSPQFKKQVTKLTKTTTQPKLAISRVEQINICLPTSLTEQQQIVDKLDKLSDICKKLEDNYNRILTECDALKQALLRKAFNGEL